MVEMGRAVAAVLAAGAVLLRAAVAVVGEEPEGLPESPAVRAIFPVAVGSARQDLESEDRSINSGGKVPST